MCQDGYRKMVWFSALKLGLNAATHIYKKKQETKMAMADAQHMHASKMARGESEYQGKLLEERRVRFGRINAADISYSLGSL